MSEKIPLNNELANGHHAELGAVAAGNFEPASEVAGEVTKVTLGGSGLERDRFQGDSRKKLGSVRTKFDGLPPLDPQS